MILKIPLYFHQNAMLYQRFCMLLIGFLYVDTFQVFAIKRSVRKRTLEGDSEKPSRHNNEGPLLILFFLFDI